MPAFLIADIDVKDPDTYADYRTANPDIVNKFGGRYVALGGDIKVLEGDWHPRRTVVIEFPDMNAIPLFMTHQSTPNSGKFGGKVRIQGLLP